MNINIQKYLKKKIQLKYCKILVQLLIQKSIRNYVIMSEENISQEFRLKNKDAIRIISLKKISENELLSNRHKKVCRVLNYIKHFF